MSEEQTEKKTKKKQPIIWTQKQFNTALWIELIQKTPKDWSEFYIAMNKHYIADSGKEDPIRPHILALRCSNAIKKAQEAIKAGKLNLGKHKIPANWEDLTKPPEAKPSDVASMWGDIAANGLTIEVDKI